MRKLLTIVTLLLAVFANAQVKIGDNPNTINANSLLELESTNKGFLPPRVVLNSLNAVAPLTGTVPAGMLVYSSGGTVADGYYFWDGSKWANVAQSNMVTKTANATLTPTETFVLASNSITLTLPVVTGADNGLTFTIKNIGIHTDQITVVGNGAATIDGGSNSKLTRWIARTYVAYGGNWIKKEKEVGTDNLFDVSTRGSWTSIAEIIDFLNLHMGGPSVVRLGGGVYPIDATQVIDLPYPLTIQGTSFGESVIEAATGLQNTPMFSCESEAYFKMLAFDATALPSYGTNAGEDAIHLVTAGEYFEIKDCNFDGFNKTIVAQSNIELWLFETDITNAVVSGVEVATGAANGVSVKISECDFTNCVKGINMLSGVNASVNILNCTFYNGAVGHIGINYVPATFTTFSTMFITNNAWNNVGAFFSGFDFTRSDGRDAKAFVQNNAGDGDKNPNCHINVLNSNVTTTLTTLNVWYKASWDYLLTTTTTTKWTITNAVGAGNVNRITYQPTNRRGGWFIISGNLSVNNSSRTISVGIVKNGASGTRFGETTIRTGTANTSQLFSTIVYISDIAPTDYFEIYCSSLNNGDVVKFQDVQWLAETK
ncbi:MAG: hypothetical protein H7122_18455 [Chitinophagaceae bacterium]|nr:hypothetical protein [Chitinophagaceae bacterium]